MGKKKTETISVRPGKIGPVFNLAIEKYLKDHHRPNKSELVREWICRMLETYGYLVQTSDGTWILSEPPRSGNGKLPRRLGEPTPEEQQ